MSNTSDNASAASPTNSNKESGQANFRPMNWVSVAKDGNTVNLDNDNDGWFEAGGKGPVASHGGKILPKFQRKRTSGDQNDEDPRNDPQDDTKNGTQSDAKNETQDVEVPEHPVFIIFSQWTISEIEDHLYSVADSKDQIGTVRIDFFKGEQTDRTIVVMDPKLYPKFRRDFVPGFSIVPYDIRPHWYPNADIDETFNFFIPLPSHLSAAACREGLRVKMRELIDFGLFESEDDFGIYIPVADRESSDHSSRAYIEFNENVDHHNIVLARCVLSYSKWSYRNEYVNAEDNTSVKCYYKKENRSRKDRNDRNDRKSSSSRPRVELKIPTIPVNSDNVNPFDILKGESADGDDSE